MATIDELMHRPIALRGAELIRCVSPKLRVQASIPRLVRRMRGLPLRFSVTQSYLHLRAQNGADGWFGPLDERSRLEPQRLAQKLHLVGRARSIADVAALLEPNWSREPMTCSAIDGALWDLVCRSEGQPLWRLLAQQNTRITPAVYASALGLTSKRAGIVRDIAAAGYPLVKWTLDSGQSIEKQVSELLSLDIGANMIALDAHGRLSIDHLKRLARLAPDFAWLEDPFASSDAQAWACLVCMDLRGLPPMVVGEDAGSRERVMQVSAFPAVHALNLEVERLGITNAVRTIKFLRSVGRPCHLHGRMPVVSCHLAMAFPDVVRWVEEHLAFTVERLATVRRPESIVGTQAIVQWCVEHKGIGVEPSEHMDCVIQHVVL